MTFDRHELKSEIGHQSGGAADNARPPIHISGVEYDKPVGKRLEPAPDGKSIIKTPLLAERKRPGKIVNRTFDTAADAFSFRLKLDPRFMFTAGTFDPGLSEGTVVPKGALDNARANQSAEDSGSIIALSNEYLDFRPGGGADQHRY